MSADLDELDKLCNELGGPSTNPNNSNTVVDALDDIINSLEHDLSVKATSSPLTERSVGASASARSSSPAVATGSLNSAANYASSGDEEIETSILNLTDKDPLKVEVALVTIINFAQDDKNRNILRERPVMSPVVKLLSSPHEQLQILAAQAVTNLCLTSSSRDDARNAGIFDPLTKLLTTSNQTLQEKALSAVSNLVADNEANRRGMRNAIKHIVKLASSANATVVNRALFALGNLCFIEETQNEAVKEGVVKVILAQARNHPNDNVILSKVCWVMAVLSMHSADAQKAIAKEGGLAVLVGSLTKSPDVEQHALTALVNLSANDELQEDVANEAGAISGLVAEISSSNRSLQQYGLQCLQNLALNKNAIDKMHAAGIVSKVLAALSTLPGNVLPVITNLCASPAVRKEFVNEGAVDKVAILMASSDDNLAAAAKQAHNNLTIKL